MPAYEALLLFGIGDPASMSPMFAGKAVLQSCYHVESRGWQRSFLDRMQGCFKLLRCSHADENGADPRVGDGKPGGGFGKRFGIPGFHDRREPKGAASIGFVRVSRTYWDWRWACGRMALE